MNGFQVIDHARQGAQQNQVSSLPSSTSFPEKPPGSLLGVW